MKSTNLLITGGCGFIGTNLIRFLAGSNYRIIVLDSLVAGTGHNLEKLRRLDPRFSGVELIVGDIRDRELVARATRGIDTAVHLATYTSVEKSLKNPQETWDVNVNGTMNLLEACRQNNANVIFASSNAAVGEQAPPIDEQKVPRPLSPYGASKLAGEALCSGYYHSYGIKSFSLRFANCYGPYSEHKTSVVATFLARVKEGKPLIIYGDGHQTRDFIHVNDICQAIDLALQQLISRASTSYGEVFQIASGVETTINELVSLIKELAGGEAQIIYEPQRKGEIHRNYSDITKARQVLGFEPRIRLKEGLKELWEMTVAV